VVLLADAGGSASVCKRICAKVTARTRRGRLAMEMIDVDGLRIAYERAGDGPPLVLLHG